MSPRQVSSSRRGPLYCFLETLSCLLAGFQLLQAAQETEHPPIRSCWMTAPARTIEPDALILYVGLSRLRGLAYQERCRRNASASALCHTKLSSQRLSAVGPVPPFHPHPESMVPLGHCIRIAHPLRRSVILISPRISLFYSWVLHSMS